MNDWKIDVEHALHYQRQFLAPEESRWDVGSCTSYVLLNRVSVDGVVRDELDLEAEITLSDGRDVVNFDASYSDEPGRQDVYLAMMCKLRDQLIAYCSAYGEALARMRGQSISSGAESVVVTNYHDAVG
mgnify:FL=1